MSQFSEGGFSDIITDVDKFIQEQGIVEDVGHLMNGIPNATPVDDETGETDTEEVEFKPLAAKCATKPPPYGIYYEAQYPPDQPLNLGTEEYSGPFNFEVLIIPSEQKTPWEYSLKLNKIFIGINLKFPVAFSLKHRPVNMNLYIRATPVFSQSQFFEEIVHRCVAHQHPHDPSNGGLLPHIFNHIIRCSNENTQYFGDKNNDTRLNVVIPLGTPQAGSDVIKEFYHFVCKNSCPSGMNRRPIDVIFTLENETGEVFGRKLVSVRICSCPKRDKEKEEKDCEKSAPQSRKRKLGGTPANVNRRDGATSDVREYNVKVCGRHNYLHVLKSARDRLGTEVLKLEGRGTDDHPYRRNFNQLDSLISKAMSDED